MILIIPLLIGILIPAHPLDATAASTRGMNVSAPLVGTSQTREFQSAADTRNILDWIVIFNSTNDLSALCRPNSEGDRFCLSRSAPASKSIHRKPFCHHLLHSRRFSNWNDRYVEPKRGLERKFLGGSQGTGTSFQVGRPTHPVDRSELRSIYAAAGSALSLSMKLRILQPLDLAAGSLALALVIIIGMVILVGTWEGIQVNIVTADESGEIGPLSSILLKFSEPVDQAIAQSLFSIQPNTSGKLDWVDTKTLRFTPLKPLQRGH